ncbi:MAG: hypothetical protein ACLPQY_27115 [Streptosporangiaceae bacterium]
MSADEPQRITIRTIGEPAGRPEPQRITIRVTGEPSERPGGDSRDSRAYQGFRDALQQKWEADERAAAVLAERANEDEPS